MEICFGSVQIISRPPHWRTKEKKALQKCNCKGPHTISAANVGSRRDLISQKKGIKTINCKADITRKTFRDTNMTGIDKAGSQQWTAVSLLLELVSTVWQRYVTPAKEPTLINCKMTRSLYQLPYFELSCAQKHALPQRMFQK